MAFLRNEFSYNCECFSHLCGDEICSDKKWDGAWNVWVETFMEACAEDYGEDKESAGNFEQLRPLRSLNTFDKNETINLLQALGSSWQ